LDQILLRNLTNLITVTSSTAAMLQKLAVSFKSRNKREVKTTSSRYEITRDI